MVAEQSIASGLAALIGAMVPVWVVLIGGRRATGARVTLAGVAFGSLASRCCLCCPGARRGIRAARPPSCLRVARGDGVVRILRYALPSNPFFSTATR